MRSRKIIKLWNSKVLLTYVYLYLSYRIFKIQYHVTQLAWRMTLYIWSSCFYHLSAASVENLNFFSIFPRTRSSMVATVKYFWARWAHLGVKRTTLLPQRWELNLGLWLMLCKPLLGELHPKTLTLFTQRKMWGKIPWSLEIRKRSPHIPSITRGTFQNRTHFLRDYITWTMF